VISEIMTLEPDPGETRFGPLVWPFLLTSRHRFAERKGRGLASLLLGHARTAPSRVPTFSATSKKKTKKKKKKKIKKEGGEGEGGKRGGGGGGGGREGGGG